MLALIPTLLESVASRLNVFPLIRGAVFRGYIAGDIDFEPHITEPTGITRVLHYSAGHIFSFLTFSKIGAILGALVAKGQAGDDQPRPFKRRSIRAMHSCAWFFYGWACEAPSGVPFTFWAVLGRLALPGHPHDQDGFRVQEEPKGATL